MYGEGCKMARSGFFTLLAIMPFSSKDIALCGSNTADIPVAPRLVSPMSPEVTITGDSLEFKWWHAAMGIRSYEFKLYKGGGPFGDVVFEKTLPFDISSVEVDAKLFENNQVYTWTLRQVADNGQRSDYSFNTFKIIKNKD